MTGNRTRGIYLAILTAIISGVSIFVNKFAVDAIRQPLVFTAVKNSGVAMLIIAGLLISGKWRKVLKVSGKELISLVAVGIIGGSLPFYLFFTGLASIPAINGALIHKTLVLWVAIMAGKVLKEKISKTTLLAVLLLFGANVLVGGFSGFKFGTGEILVLAATILWAAETVLVKKILPKTDPDVLIAARMGFGSLILLSAASIFEPAALAKSLILSPSQFFWLGLTTVALWGYVTSWYRALLAAPATIVTAVLVGSTLITNILSAVFITHTFNYLVLVQSLLIMIGIMGLWMTETGRKLFNKRAIKPAVQPE
jgi:drug/metabolite transporter (DMT)-like permease